MSDQQTPYGLATWLASMDEPGSSWRPKVTLQGIIDEAKRAVETGDPIRRQRDELLEAIREHQTETSHGITANADLADKRLYETFDRIQSKGGDASERGHEAVPSTRVARGEPTEQDGLAPETSQFADDVIDQLQAREDEARASLTEHRRKRDPQGTSAGSLIRYTEARIYREARWIVGNAWSLLDQGPVGEAEDEFYFTCCNWDKLSPESKRAVEQIVKAAAGKLDSPLTGDERAEYDAARQSVVDARHAGPGPVGEGQ